MWERGSPDLPACGLQRGSSGGPVRPIFISTRLKTLARGQASRGGRRKTSSGSASLGWLPRGGEIKAMGTLRGPYDASHDYQGQAGARQASACAVSLFPLRCKGSKHMPRHRAKVTISVQRDQDQQSGRTEVTVDPKTTSSPVLLAAEDHLWSG